MRRRLLERGSTLLNRISGEKRVPVAARALLLRGLLPGLHRALSMPELLELIAGEERSGEANRIGAERIDEVLRKTERLLRRPPLLRTTCFYRALVRYAILSSEGIAGLRFVMGVHTRDGELLGHAWLEHEGRPVGESLEHPYRTTFSYPVSEERNEQC